MLVETNFRFDSRLTLRTLKIHVVYFCDAKEGRSVLFRQLTPQTVAWTE